jgi:DNA end-binding protein Ku
MAARAIWKARLKLGRWSLPVKLYAAVQDRSIHFHLLSSSTGRRVRQRMTHPETDEEVPAEEIKKGLEMDPGSFVLLSEEELKRIRPAPSRDIEITRFVPKNHINNQWYERPYYIGPDGDTTNYFALAEALGQRNREGVARWTMRDRHYVGALSEYDGYLSLISLRHPEEVVSPQELPSPGGRAPDKRELQMAEQLISALEDEFRPQEFHDEYRERVLAFIDKKAEGKRPRLVALKTKKPSSSLADQLSRSLKASKRLKEKKVA